VWGGGKKGQKSAPPRAHPYCYPQEMDNSTVIIKE
jgi:hypothetical protein